MLNKVVLIGRLTRDPELRYTNNNNVPVVSFTLAVNRPYSSNSQNPNDNSGSNADFIPCIAWRNQAENVSKYVQKGSLVAVEGRIQTRDYTDKDNVRRYVTEIVCDSVVFLETRAQRENMANQNENNSSKNNNNENRDRDEDKAKSINIIEDDLPF